MIILQGRILGGLWAPAHGVTKGAPKKEKGKKGEKKKGKKGKGRKEKRGQKHINMARRAPFRDGMRPLPIFDRDRAPEFAWAP